MNRFVVVSGCSGGGKSTLLTELQRRGFSVVEEPGRRIVRRELEAGGRALPWIDGVAFARRAVALSLADRRRATGLTGRVFFDRGLIDAVAALRHLTDGRAFGGIESRHRYNRIVFMTPPWPDLYVQDTERRHGFDEAVAEYDRLSKFYPNVGYEIISLPKANVRDRADFVLDTLDANSASAT